MRKLGMRCFFVPLLLLLMCQGVAAQDTQSLSVDLNLDVGVVNRPLDLEITINNHSFVFIFPATIIRPITSSQSTLVTLPAGATSVTAFLDDLVLDEVDYTVEINCLGCADTVPQQYFSPEGNATGQIDSVFLDPDEFVDQIDVSLITRAQISGQIRLLPGQLAESDLEFEVSVINALTLSELANTQITLAAGQNNVDYLIRGLTRSATTQLEVLARCLNCGGIFPRSQTFSQLLSTQTDSTDIDFEFDTENLFILNGIFHEILSEP